MCAVRVSYRLSAQLGLGTPTARRLQDNAVPSLFGESIFKSRGDIKTSRPVVAKLDRKIINLEAVPQPTAVKIQRQDSAECTYPSTVNVTHVEVQCSLVPLPLLKLLTGPTETRTPPKQPGPSHSGNDGLSAAVASSSGYTEKPPSVHSSDENEHDKDDASRFRMELFDYLPNFCRSGTLGEECPVPVRKEPPPLASSYVLPNNEDAIKQHRSRFQKLC
ncbi:hypothetical protein BSL78_19092 [Apostichopus japonicus]|uniref:Uncharacterized protein n=1 Tax=Stichopus japonicus TaxID=307972 RepID=A0A2G8K7P8_STIJA|nr:hypothetical protein BSL78_19092 [Apostichopus japonicus]